MLIYQQPRRRLQDARCGTKAAEDIPQIIPLLVAYPLQSYQAADPLDAYLQLTAYSAQNNRQGVNQRETGKHSQANFRRQTLRCYMLCCNVLVSNSMDIPGLQKIGTYQYHLRRCDLARSPPDSSLSVSTSIVYRYYTRSALICSVQLQDSTLDTMNQ